LSPVARRQGGAHTGRAVAVAVVGVVVALGVAFGVAELASRGEVDVNLGDDRFEAGDAARRAETIEDGGPVLFPDPANFRRSIYLDHVGDDPEQGWSAVGAFVPDRPDCGLLFVPEDDRYVADCDDSLTFPRNGRGLRRFPTEVVDGDLFVDLRSPAG
jgi:hypothetical protein